MMKFIATALFLTLFALDSMTGAAAQDLATCQAQAVSKTTGEPLVGASKIASINRCMRDTCEAEAVDKNGNKLAGLAKNSFMRKCLKGS